MNLHLVYLLALSIFGPSSLAAEKRLSLEEFLAQVREESPDLAVESARVEASAARASGIRLSPPMIGFMQMKEGGNTRNGFEVAQEIPFPTKVIQAKKARNLEKESQESNSSYQRASVLAEARETYIRYWGAFERLQILKERHHWLVHHLKLTRSATRSDSSAQIHLLEIESEADLAENEVVAMEAELTERANEMKIFAPSLSLDFLKPTEPAMTAAPVEKGNSSSFLNWKRQELASKEALENLGAQTYLPDIFLRFRSFNANQLSPKSQELMVGVSVPFLFFWQPRAEAAEASSQRIQAEAELHKATIESSSRLISLSKKLEATKSQLRNVKEKLIPRAERRRKLVSTLSQRTMEGLDDHRSAMLALLDSRLKAVDLRLDYERAYKELQKLMDTQEEGL